MEYSKFLDHTPERRPLVAALQQGGDGGERYSLVELRYLAIQIFRVAGMMEGHPAPVWSETRRSRRARLGGSHIADPGLVAVYVSDRLGIDGDLHGHSVRVLGNI